MDVNDFLQTMQRRGEYRDQIAHIREIPAREARYGMPREPLPEAIADALSQEKIERLYEHQSLSVDMARSGRDLMIVTGTASGKTMCYNLPVIETLLSDPSARAMYIFPTKALAQDQLARLKRWAGYNEALKQAVRPATYDGDTPSSQRTRIRKQASIILTNPDMLHQGILPYHAKWSEFLRNLRWLVIDEMHIYRGIFGSQVANVLRRLDRVLEFHGAECRYIGCSATIGNPQELGELLTGRKLDVIEKDGSPRGKKYFVLWNPPFVDDGRVVRRSANIEGKRLFTELVRSGVQTIVFTRARVVAELIYKYAVEEFRQHNENELGKRIKPYRGGFLPEERRQIEQQLFSGKLMGVSATTALELGIDVGSLDAAVLVGYPGTVSSAWQQAGRAGRRSEQSLAILVAYNDPIDQYLMHHPDYFFSRNVERAIVDPSNPHILASQLACAAFELPLAADDGHFFGPKFASTLEALAGEEGQLRRIVDRWYHASSTFPAAHVNLRTISESSYAVVDASGKENQVIGSIDSTSAPEQLYPGAVYLHEGRSYVVSELDLATRVAMVKPAEVDYYTQPVLHSRSEILADEAQATGPCGAVTFGRVKVIWQTVAFKKLKFYTMEVVGQDALDLPELDLDTRGLWFLPDESIWDEVRDAGYVPIQALSGLRNLMIWSLPILAMCDPQDIGGQINVNRFQRPAIILYDRYLGGLGFSRRGFDEFETLLKLAHQIVAECTCEGGCPSCVGLPLLRAPIHQDPDLQGRPEIPDKEGTLFLLERFREREWRMC